MNVTWNRIKGLLLVILHASISHGQTSTSLLEIQSAAAIAAIVVGAVAVVLLTLGCGMCAYMVFKSEPRPKQHMAVKKPIDFERIEAVNSIRGSRTVQIQNPRREQELLKQDRMANLYAKQVSSFFSRGNG